MKIKLSIIVPVYNIEQYLSVCIESILQQDVDGLELILVDDGASDSSGKICDEYAKKCKKIKVVHKTNGGLSSARNAGLDIASGDFIGFVDGDDWIDKSMYILLLRMADEHNADIAACNMNMMRRDGTLTPYFKDAKDFCFSKKEALEELPSNRILTFSACNKIYKKHLFSTLRFREGIIFEDMDLSYKILSKSEKIIYIGKPLYYYRYNERSILRKEFTLSRLDEYHVRKEMYVFYLNSFPEMAGAVFLQFFLATNNLYLLAKKYAGQEKTTFDYLITYDKKALRGLIQQNIKLKYKINAFLFLISPRIALAITSYKNHLGSIVYNFFHKRL